MTFSSYPFILAFAPLCVLLYYLIGGKYGTRAGIRFLITASLLFCLMNGLYNLGILSLSIVANYLFFSAVRRPGGRRKAYLVAGIVADSVFLFSFKLVPGIAFPLGVSFYTFQNISLLVEAYNDNPVLTGISIRDYLLYETYFPKLAQGPITPPDQFFGQIRHGEKVEPDWEKLTKGLFLFSIGLAKKTVLADSFAGIADIGFSEIENLNSLSAILTIVSYTIQVYFDFSGYCDMALGISRMLGFEIPANFNSPYKAVSISDFWKRWHITLTSFLTRYVYIPLGGNRKGFGRTLLNILIVFLISGLWHGTGMTFIVWGLLHGLAMVLDRILREKKIRIPRFIGWLLTMLFVSLTWVFFRSSSISDALLLMRKVSELRFDGVHPGFIPLLQPSFAKYLIPQGKLRYLGYFIFDAVVPFYALFVSKNSMEIVESSKPNLKTACSVVLLFVIGLCSITGVQTFIYMAF